MKTLCLFTNEFPYGNWEPYLETEIRYYNEFDKIYIFSLQLRKEHAKTIRKMPDNVEVIPVWYAPKWKYLLNALRVLTDRNLYEELRDLFYQKKLNFQRLVSLFVFLSRANYETRQISKNIRKEDIEGAVFYSYRFEYQPYVAVLLRQKYKLNNKIICRAHGFDLYEERRSHGYIPLRKYLLNQINHVFPCSQFGARYLYQKFPFCMEKVTPFFLGTLDCGEGKKPDRRSFSVVSCSTLVPIKRVELIAEALGHIKGKEIRWVHFGEGPLRLAIEEIVRGLSHNIVVEFRGYVANVDLMQEYRNRAFDLFLNLSSSEGIPVSIMEANSFGIPAIATDVGGTSELVKTGINGVLVRKNVTALDVAQEIEKILSMPDADYFLLRERTREYWYSHFNADANYKNFVKEL